MTSLSTNQACPPLLEATKPWVLRDTEAARAAAWQGTHSRRPGSQGEKPVTSGSRTQTLSIAKQSENQSPSHGRDAPGTAGDPGRSASPLRSCTCTLAPGTPGEVPAPAKESLGRGQTTADGE